MNDLSRKNKRGRKWFDGKSEKDVIALLKQVWAYGGTDAEAASLAEVSKDSVSRYLQVHEDVKELRDRLKERPILKARQTVVSSLDDPYVAFKYLERKRKEEFAERHELGGEVKLNLWQEFIKKATRDAPRYLDSARS